MRVAIILFVGSVVASTTTRELLAVCWCCAGIASAFQQHRAPAATSSSVSSPRNGRIIHPSISNIICLEASSKDEAAKIDSRRRSFYGPEDAIKAAAVRKGRVPYGEESRKYRRTVYLGTDDWVEHRRSERIVANLWGIFFSGVVRQIRQQVFLVASVATAIVLLNQPDTGIVLDFPSLPFQLSSPALGLLLVFRTNSSYARWTLAHATWMKVVAQSRNAVRMASTFTDLSTPQARAAHRPKLTRLSRANWLLARSLMNRFLSDAEDEAAYCAEVQATLEDDDAKLVHRILQAPDRAAAALVELSLAVDNLPVDEKRRVEIDKSIVLLGDCLSTCEGIYRCPVPLVYTRHTSRFLTLFLLLLPVALVEPFSNEQAAGALLFRGFSVIPAVTLVAIFLYGIEELAVQLEEPFSILPLQQFCDEVKDSCTFLIDWRFDSALFDDQPEPEPTTAPSSVATEDKQVV